MLEPILVPSRPDGGQVPTRIRRVVVVVVTYNSAAVLPGLLASLDAGLRGLAWELVVADNASVDATVEVARQLAPTARVLAGGRNRGYAAGINAAVAAAGGDHDAVLVLNPDVRLDPGCVRSLARALEEPGVGIAVPRLRDGEGELVRSMRGEPSLLRALCDALVGARRAGRSRRLGEIVADPAEYDRAQDSDWAEGSTQLVSRACWEACGSWDESFFLYSEETDFHLRARDAGFRLRYVPAARAMHLGGESTTSAALWALLVANRVRLYARRRGPLRATAYWALVLLRESSRAVLGYPTSRRAVRTLLSPRRMRARRGPDWLERA